MLSDFYHMKFANHFQFTTWYDYEILFFCFWKILHINVFSIIANQLILIVLIIFIPSIIGQLVLKSYQILLKLLKFKVPSV